MADLAELNSGHKIPMVGLGTYLIKGTDFTNKVIVNALSAGYRLFDTAQMYKNEKYLGSALKNSLAKYNLKREDIFITTKFAPSIDYKTEQDYLNIIKESLENLQVDYLDMMLIHWPGVDGIPNDSEDVITYRHNAWKALIKFKEQGLIRSIGVSNFLIKHIEAMKKECDVLPAVNQVEYHPLFFDSEMLNYCNKNGILLQAHSSLGTSGSTSLRNHSVVKKIAENLNKSSARVLLRWSNLRKVAVIPKATSLNHLVENISLNFEIPADMMETLDNMNVFHRFDEDPSDIQ